MNLKIGYCHGCKMTRLIKPYNGSCLSCDQKSLDALREGEKLQARTLGPERLPSLEYFTGDGRVAYVAPGRMGGQFTFYLRPMGSRGLKGSRVKGRGRPLWFDTRSQAEAALAVYAKQRGWGPGFHMGAALKQIFNL